VTIYAIGVGNRVSQESLNKIASLHCSYLVNDFESAFKVMQLGITIFELLFVFVFVFMFLFCFVFDGVR
jgi:hypothetical protein